MYLFGTERLRDKGEVYICFLSCCSRETPDKRNLKRERFALLQSLRYSSLWQGSRAGVAWGSWSHCIPKQREAWMFFLVPFVFLIQPWTLAHGLYPPPLRYHNLENPSQTFPGACIHGNSKSHQVDHINHRAIHFPNAYGTLHRFLKLWVAASYGVTQLNMGLLKSLETIKVFGTLNNQKVNLKSNV